MAKKKWSGGRVKSIDDFKDDSRTINVDIGDYFTKEMTLFGANMVMARHLPFNIDGLKPGARRALVTIWRAVKRGKISMSRACADTMAIHQHGDTSVFDTIVIMAQPWKKMQPLIDSLEENYGSAKGFGDKEAAARYLKTALTPYAVDCFFSDYDEKVVEMKPSYDEDLTEPLYLPAKYPNLFINGGDGMAWGFGAAIPIYNITDILEYTIHLIKSPEEPYKLLYPDTPTGCDIINNETAFRNLQFEGFKSEDIRSWSYMLQSVIVKDEKEHTLTLINLPPMRTAEAFLVGVADMYKNKQLPGCIKIQDESQGDRVHIRLRFKPETNLDEVREKLYSASLGTRCPFAAQTTVVNNKNSFNMSVERYSVRDCLLAWIAWRRDFKRRFLNRKIVESNAELYSLRGMMHVYEDKNWKKAEKIIRESDSKDEMNDRLREEFGLDSVQVNAIGRMTNYDKVKNARKKALDRIKELEEIVEKNINLVKSNKKIDKLIISELEEGIKKYGCPRNSRIIEPPDKETIPDTKHTIVITTNGQIKKFPSHTKRIGKINPKDSPMEAMSGVRNKETLLIFDNFGRVHFIPVHVIPSCDLSSPGENINNFARLDNAEIVAVFRRNEEGDLVRKNHTSSHGCFLFTTKLGMIKKTLYDEYSGGKNSLIGIKLKERDSLISVKYFEEEGEVITFTFNGTGLRYSTESFRATGRNTYGVGVFNIDADTDAVKDTVILKDGYQYLMTVTLKGMVKKINLDLLSEKKRRGEPGEICGLDDGDILLYCIPVNDNDSFTVVLKKGIQEFSVGEDVSLEYKNAKGKKLIMIPSGDMIVKLLRR